MCPDDRAEQFPGASPPVDANHAQDLKEAQSAQCRGSKHLATAAQTEDDNTGRNHN